MSLLEWKRIDGEEFVNEPSRQMLNRPVYLNQRPALKQKAEDLGCGLEITR